MPEVCNKMIFQDDNNIRCCLLVGHDGICMPESPKAKLTVKPHLREKIIYEEDPRYKDVSRGDGLILTIPTWAAEILERHAEEIDGLP